MIDAIGPFFIGHDRRQINRSKTPFAHLATERDPGPTRFEAICEGIDTAFR